MLDTSYLTSINDDDKEAVQKIAEAIWAVATAHNEISAHRSATYQMLDSAFLNALFQVYRLTSTLAGHVRDLLSEYGPDDRLDPYPHTASTARGVESYVRFALLHPRKVAH
jgi:hypothetical protein